MEQHMDRNVLVVDDDYSIRELMSTVLEDEGIDVVTAANGREALQRLEIATEQPCLILLDLNMPIMNGWEFRDEQQRHPDFATIPVAIISADRSIIQKQATIDAVAYLAKPLDFNQLFDVLTQYCA